MPAESRPILLEKNGIKVREELMVKCDTHEEALEITKEIMSLSEPPDAIFAVNDLTAIGALKVLRQLNVRVPENVSVIGFTDGLVATVTDPPLTTVSQHGFEIGKKATEMLLRRINALEEDYPASTEIIPTELIIRGTTRPLPK